jgi:hypothetical protein
LQNNLTKFSSFSMSSHCPVASKSSLFKGVINLIDVGVKYTYPECIDIGRNG